jgi:hypothetical protein
VNEALRSTLLAELRTANSGFPSYDELQDEYKQAMTEYQAASARYKLGLVVSEFDTEGWTMSVGKDSNGAYFRVEAPDIGDWRFAIQGQQGEGGENMTVTGIAQADLYRISNELSVIAVMNFGDIGRTYQNNQLRTHSGGVLDTRLEADDLLGASGGLGIQWTGQIPLGAGAVVSPYATVMAGEAGVGVSRTGGGFAVNGPSGQAGVGVTFPINNFMAATGRLYMSVDSTPGVGGNALGGGGAFALTGRF